MENTLIGYEEEEEVSTFDLADVNDVKNYNLNTIIIFSFEF